MQANVRKENLAFLSRQGYFTNRSVADTALFSKKNANAGVCGNVRSEALELWGLEGAQPTAFWAAGARSVFEPSPPPSSRNPNLPTLLKFRGAISPNKMEGWDVKNC